MDFGTVLRELKLCKRLARVEWEVGQYIYLVPGSVFKDKRPPLDEYFEKEVMLTYAPHIDMITGTSCTPWTPTTMDLLAKDWFLVNDTDL